MSKKLQITKEELEHLYIESLMTTREIGELLGVTHRTILNHLISHSIPRGESRNVSNLSFTIEYGY